MRESHRVSGSCLRSRTQRYRTRQKKKPRPIAAVTGDSIVPARYYYRFRSQVAMVGAAPSQIPQYALGISSLRWEVLDRVGSLESADQRSEQRVRNAGRRGQPQRARDVGQMVRSDTISYSKRTRLALATQWEAEKYSVSPIELRLHVAISTSGLTYPQ